MRLSRLNPLVFLLAPLGPCDGSVAMWTPPAPATEVAMSFSRAGGLWDAPFPSDDLRRPDGRIDLARFPNPDGVQLVAQSLGLLAGAKGFAQTAAVYFAASAPIDPSSLPTIERSLREDAAVFVAPLDTKYQRAPLDVTFLADGGPYGAPNMLALLPVQGRPLRPGTTYAAVVTTRVRDAGGAALAPAKAVRDLVAGLRPDGLSDVAWERYADALQILKNHQRVDPSEIAALTVFTTGTPTVELTAVVEHMRARPLPALAVPRRGEVFDDYCVYNSAVSLPVYQEGAPPYAKTGGGWRFSPGGEPILDHEETARVVFTVPRAKAPAGGWPLALFVRTGGGGDRPLVDRGVAASPEFMQPVVPGSGPARDLARVGFAGVQIDGPLGGKRNPNDTDEQFLVFNVFNPAALRDNVRQSAAELALFADAVAPFRFDASDCPGAGPGDPPGEVRFDGAHLALMGHSMGAWIAPLTSAEAPRFGALVLSGAGGSYIANVMDKQHPTPVRMFAEILLGYQDRPLTPHDPGLSLLQWAAEPSDPQVYDARVVHEPAPHTAPRHVLMVQGIVDHYILPSIANATSLALGLDLGGTPHDEGNAELMRLAQTPLQTLLPLAQRRRVDLPAAGNVDGKVTALVVQHPADGIQDGHEVFFQTGPPKHQYRCFLASWLRGVPSVPPDGPQEAPCP